MKISMKSKGDVHCEHSAAALARGSVLHRRTIYKTELMLRPVACRALITWKLPMIRRLRFPEYQREALYWTTGALQRTDFSLSLWKGDAISHDASISNFNDRGPRRVNNDREARAIPQLRPE
jgi:hypothetical protein